MTRTRKFPAPDPLNFSSASAIRSKTRRRPVFPSYKQVFHSLFQNTVPGSQAPLCLGRPLGITASATLSESFGVI